MYNNWCLSGDLGGARITGVWADDEQCLAMLAWDT